jgi:RNA polymerase sigma factor (sigma-70 family)
MINNNELFKKYQDEKTIKNRNEIVGNNYGLVGTIVTKLNDKTVSPTEDLFQIGVLGLIKAVERFDISRGNQFSTFAIHFIRGEIAHYLRDKTSYFSGRPDLRRLNLKTCNKKQIEEYHNYFFIDSLNIKVGFNDNAELIDILPANEKLENIYLEDLLSSLNEKERFLLIEHYIHDQQFKTIATTLSHSPSHISNLHRQCLTKIRNRCLKLN